MNHKYSTTWDVSAREGLGLATLGTTVPSSKGGGGHKLCNNCTCATCAKWLDGAITTQWGDSKAKKYIHQCLESDANHSYWVMKPGEVYQPNQLLFHQFKYTNFWTNLNTLTAKPLQGSGGNKKLPPHRIPMVGIVKKVPSTTNTTIHKHHHYGGAIHPSYGVESMDPHNPMQVTLFKGVGQGHCFRVLYKSIN
jgi:hypothetical protein